MLHAHHWLQRFQTRMKLLTSEENLHCCALQGKLDGKTLRNPERVPQEVAVATATTKGAAAAVVASRSAVEVTIPMSEGAAAAGKATAAVAEGDDRTPVKILAQRSGRRL
mmetsp:Transcript_110077/g.194578  ORF Transcript_110077/g.194578 Transcript_110077/m.194578 type:complete len:110 (+) Transcript_110077:235-564(+)